MRKDAPDRLQFNNMAWGGNFRVDLIPRSSDSIMKSSPIASLPLCSIWGRCLWNKKSKSSKSCGRKEVNSDNGRWQRCLSEVHNKAKKIESGLTRSSEVLEKEHGIRKVETERRSTQERQISREVLLILREADKQSGGHGCTADARAVRTGFWIR